VGRGLIFSLSFDGGMGAARLRPSNRDRSPQPHSARNQKWGHKGPIFIFWRGGESRADDAPSTPGPLFQFYQNQFPRGIGNILGQMLATRNEQGIARIG
jgi:hypothetical protein